MKNLSNDNKVIDAIDIRILEALFDNARMPVAELARRIDLSAPSTAERLRRLEENGVIEGYTIRVNPQRLGLMLPVCLRIRPVPGRLEKVAQILAKLDEVIDCDRVTGEDCFIARAHVRSVAHMETLIDKLTPYAMTNTAIIQSSPIPHRLPALQTS